MGVPSAGEIAVARAEEDAHVAAELGEARGGEGAPETVTMAELQTRLKGTGAGVGGVVSSAEIMTIYNRHDGVPSQITTDQAGQRLRVRFDSTHPWAGQLVWTTKPPDTPRVLGTLKCPLHPESDQRAYLDTLHFQGKTCPKATLPTEYDVGTHFEKAHKKIYLAVEADKTKQLQLQQMELMREQTAAMQAMAAAQGVGVPSATCDVDGCAYQGTPNQLRGHKMGAHKERVAEAT